ncbi:hypothetical protein ACLOJK_041577 [Asimina triloba]
MDQIESSIRRVLQDHHKISSSVRSEEAKIDALNKEVKELEDRIRDAASGDGSPELERQRMRNLLTYQSTLIARAASRTELLRALHEDLLALFLRRKQLRQCDGSSRSGVDVVPNVSLSSGLSSGDDDNRGFLNNGPLPGSLDIIKASVDDDNLEEVTTEQVQLPLGLKMLQINVNEDACLTPEDGIAYGDLRYKNNILGDIPVSILDPKSNVDNIFKETVESSNFACNEAHGMLVTGCIFMSVFKQIGDVPVEDYKSVLNMLTVKKDLERGIEPQKPSYVKKEDWDAFFAKTKDENFDKGLEQGLVTESIWSKVPKPMRGRPRKILAAVEDSQNVSLLIGPVWKCSGPVWPPLKAKNQISANVGLSLDSYVWDVIEIWWTCEATA